MHETNAPAMGTNVIALAGSDYHSVALLADRSVRAWGDNYYGQTNVPDAATNTMGIAAGNYNSLAVNGNGGVLMWGRMANPPVPVFVPPEVTNVVALGVGRGALHSVALRADGTVVDWGWASTNVPDEAFSIVSVAAGSYHSLALRSDGRVVSWGIHANPVPASATNIVAIAAGDDTSVAVRANGRLLTWGSISAPPFTISNVVEVGCFQSGGGITLNSKGVAIGWGMGFGAPSIAATNIMTVGATTWGALAVKAAGPPIFPLPAIRRTVASGQTSYLRLRAVGALPLAYQWFLHGTNLPAETKELLVVTNASPAAAGMYSIVASNALGVITNSSMELVVVPFIIVNQPTNQAVYVGANPTLSVSVYGQSPSYQWRFNGTNISGAMNSSLTLNNVQLANAGQYSVSISNAFGGIVSSNASVAVWPILVTQTPQDRVIFEGGTATFTHAALAGSPLSYQWQFNGNNLADAMANSLTLTNVRYEQAGLYTVVAATTNSVVTNTAGLSVVPVAAWGANASGQTDIPADLTNVIALDGGAIHSLALKSDGSVVAWRGDSIRTNVPIDLTNAVAVSAGNWGSLALRENGTIAAWGNYSQGQTNIPPGLNNVVGVSAGGNHNLALRNDGTVLAWGANGSSQTNVPPGLTDVVAVAAGESTSLALTKHGRVIAWGSNGASQTNVPSDLTNVVAIAAGKLPHLALRADGTVAVWGGTSSYGLGEIPAAATNVVAIAAGDFHCLVLRADGTLIAWGYEGDGRTTIPDGLRGVTSIACGSSHGLALVGGAPFGQSVLLVDPIWSNNVVQITVQSQSGRVYRLEHKDDISGSNWIGLPLVAGTGGELTLTDHNATSSQRFYRVRRW